MEGEKNSKNFAYLMYGSPLMLSLNNHPSTLRGKSRLRLSQSRGAGFTSGRGEVWSVPSTFLSSANYLSPQSLTVSNKEREEWVDERRRGFSDIILVEHSTAMGMTDASQTLERVVECYIAVSSRGQCNLLEGRT